MKPKLIFLLPAIAATAVLASCNGPQMPVAARNEAVTSGPVPAASVAASAAPGNTALGAPAQAKAAAGAAMPGIATSFQGAAALQPLPPLKPLVIKNGSLNIVVDDP